MPPQEASFGEQLRQLRKRRGLTQSELAGDTYTKSYISQLERNLTAPSLKAVDFLSRRLGVSPLTLIAPCEMRVRTAFIHACAEFASGHREKAAEQFESLFDELAGNPTNPLTFHCGFWLGGVHWLNKTPNAALLVLTATKNMLEDRTHMFPMHTLKALLGLTFHSLNMPAQAKTLLKSSILNWKVVYPAQLYWYLQSVHCLLKEEPKCSHERSLVEQIRTATGPATVDSIAVTHYATLNSSTLAHGTEPAAELLLFTALRPQSEQLLFEILDLLS